MFQRLGKEVGSQSATPKSSGGAGVSIVFESLVNGDLMHLKQYHVWYLHSVSSGKGMAWTLSSFVTFGKKNSNSTSNAWYCLKWKKEVIFFRR